MRKAVSLFAGAGGFCCELMPNGSAKKFDADRFWPPPKNRSNRPSAETLPGTSMVEAARDAAAINIARRRMREKANSLRNAYSTQRNITR